MASREHVIFSAQCHRPDAVFDKVVVNMEPYLVNISNKQGHKEKVYAMAIPIPLTTEQG